MEGAGAAFSSLETSVDQLRLDGWVKLHLEFEVKIDSSHGANVRTHPAFYGPCSLANEGLFVVWLVSLQL